MLQRIQTVYLLIIVALSLAMMFLSLGTLQIDADFYTYEITGVVTADGTSQMIYPTWSVFALMTIIALISMVTIFMYKRRILQIRLCIFNGILMVAFYGLFFYYYFDFLNVLETSYHVSLRYPMVFPFISLVLDYLAIRNIGADEALVRSLERLR